MEGSAPADAPAAIDPEACELDALLLFLESNTTELDEIAAGCPRRIPDKARRSHDRLRRALLERWAWPDVRAYLAARMLQTDLAARLVRGDVDVAHLLAEGFPPHALLWWLQAAGLESAAVLAALDAEGRAEFASRQRELEALGAHLREIREGRRAAAGEAQARRARAEAELRTRHLRWQAEAAEEKRRRAAAQVESVAQAKEAEIRRLEADLAEVRRRLAEREAANADLREALEAAARTHRAALGEMADRARELAAAARRAGAALPPLAAERVLVIGDDSHKADYRGTVQELGGRFAFHPGFDLGPRLDAALASATLVVYVAAYAAHAAQERLRRAERAGLPVIVVRVAGAESFRRALLAWCASRP